MFVYINRKEEHKICNLYKILKKVNLHLLYFELEFIQNRNNNRIKKIQITKMY